MTAGMRYFGPDTPLFVPYSTREFPSASLLKTPQSKPTMPSASSEAATTPRPKVSIPCRPRFPKRLRSCLSPSRTPSSSSGICTPESRPASRATSFSSEVSLGVGSDGYSVDGPHDGQWKRSKSVRWEGEDEDDGASVVTSYYSTYSASEYDRTPLEPPSQEERNCVLPARGSRCFGTQIDCFNASFALAPPSNAHASAAVAIDAEASGDASVESGSSTSLDMFTTPPIHQAEFSSIDEEEEDASSATSDVEDCDVVKTDEDREWEECMERRRMMFAMRCKETKDEQPECGQPAFEGYRSLGATLAQLLDSIDRHPSIGCDVGPSQSQPDHEAIQRGRSLERLQDVLEDEVEERPAQGYSLSFGRTERIELEDEDDSEAEDEIDAEAQHRRDQFVFTNLHNLRLDTNDLDLQPHTRTCSSSDSSDLSDQILATPQGSSVTSEGDHERAHAFDAGHEGSPLELTTSISTPKAHLATLPEVPEFES